VLYIVFDIELKIKDKYMRLINKIQQIIKSIKTTFYSYIGKHLTKQRKGLIPMRDLSETEKGVVKRLVEWEKILKSQPDNYFQLDLSILFSDICKKYNSSFEIEFDNGIIELKSTSELRGTGLAENNSFRRDFISLLHFIDYLKNEKLIYLVPSDPDVYEPPLTYSALIHNRTPFVSKITDVEFIEIINSNYQKYIYPTEVLSNYYRNKFRTNEEVRYENTLDVAKQGVIKANQSLKVAIGVGIATILLTIFTLFLKPNNDTELILNRIDRLEEKTNSKLVELEKNLIMKIEDGDNKIIIRLDSIDNRLKKVEEVIFIEKPWEEYYKNKTKK
jgi:hypothetical protein